MSQRDQKAQPGPFHVDSGPTANGNFTIISYHSTYNSADEALIILVKTPKAKIYRICKGHWVILRVYPAVERLGVMDEEIEGPEFIGPRDRK